MSETGVLKFTCEHTVRRLSPFSGFAELNDRRARLRSLGLIGVDAHGIGFGNASVRDGLTNEFYITGSGTGAKKVLLLSDYSRVVDFDFATNWVKCEGMTVASAESLTHAAIYKFEPKADAVIHGHSEPLWKALRNKAPTASAAVAYGTPEMAIEVKRLFETTDLRSQKFFVMAGHPDGVVAFGGDLEEAMNVLTLPNPLL